MDIILKNLVKQIKINFNRFEFEPYSDFNNFMFRHRC